MAKTAAELMAELAKNKKYQANKEKADHKRSSLEAFYKKDEKDLISELESIGFSVCSVWDFVNSENNYTKAVPVLIKHLSIGHHPRILSGILRSLAVPKLSENDNLWDHVVRIYMQSKSDKQINTPEERGLQESAAVALDALANKSRVNSIESIIESIPNGDGIIWLKEKLKKLKD